MCPHLRLRQLVARGGRRACRSKNEYFARKQWKGLLGIWKTYVALAADGLLAVVLGGKSLQGGLNDTTSETEDKVKSGLLLNIDPLTCLLAS